MCSAKTLYTLYTLRIFYVFSFEENVFNLRIKYHLLQNFLCILSPDWKGLSKALELICVEWRCIRYVAHTREVIYACIILVENKELEFCRGLVLDEKSVLKSILKKYGVCKLDWLRIESCDRLLWNW